ncbi:hypothetical protein CEXT_511711 [Caerostris extrusa]|uniref:Uncharacterized protein n=1 Tax=Caerostris extrusa TaxID=172846 RepID=A0AAV4VUM3_CAEEX|nr:hypothetical protein CEXT_511711 [Caerostris extrusa]
MDTSNNDGTGPLQSLQNIIVHFFKCNNFDYLTFNCHRTARCLKCPENHLTGEYTIKEKLLKPTCIKGQAKDHVASWRAYLAFPKTKHEELQFNEKFAQIPKSF